MREQKRSLEAVISDLLSIKAKYAAEPSAVRWTLMTVAIMLTSFGFTDDRRAFRSKISRPKSPSTGPARTLTHSSAFTDPALILLLSEAPSIDSVCMDTQGASFTNALYRVW